MIRAEDLPLVSVIIPSYNCASYIQEAIESVLTQTYTHYEVIVVDGSDDDTAEMLRPYEGKIRYIRQDPSGVGAARNLGVRHSRGELIAFQDADDVWLPEKLAMQVRALEQHPEAGLVFTDWFHLDEYRRPRLQDRLRNWIEKHTRTRDLTYGPLYDELLTGNCINTSSVVVKREVLGEVGLFDETLQTCEDYDLWLRIARKFPVVVVNHALSGYRIRSDGLSGCTETREFRWGHDSIRVLDKHLRERWIPCELQQRGKNALSERCWRLGWKYFSMNRVREARSLFIQGMRYRPFDGYHWIYWGASFLPLPMVEVLRQIKRQYVGDKQVEVRDGV